MENAFGVIEFSSIPAGYRIYNRILKDVHIRIYQNMIIAPGRLVVMFEGSYAAADHAIEWAVNSCAGGIIDYAQIGNINRSLASYLEKGRREFSATDVGLFESETVCGGIELANRILHTAPVELIGLNYNVEMHGKCLIAVGGTISSVKAAIETAGCGELVSNVEPAVLESITGITGEMNG